MIKIGVVDDHTLFRKSLISLAGSFKDIAVVIEAENGSGLLKQLEMISADIVLLDIQMPGMDGYETCGRVRELHPKIKILMLSQFSSKEHIQRSIDVGADGYFTKDSHPLQLELAINEIGKKGFYFGMELSALLKDTFTFRNKGSKTFKLQTQSVLTKRELEIIKMACREKSSHEIADALFINHRTVDAHRNKIMEKTGCKNFIGVIIYALKNNYIYLEDL